MCAHDETRRGARWICPLRWHGDTHHWLVKVER